MIVVCGEALIDLRSTSDMRYDARLGGGPFNTAIAAARLGSTVAYFGRLSHDHFGQRLRAALVDGAVDLSLALEGPEPTALAVVDLDDRGDATYTFHVADTADRLLQVGQLPALPALARIVHFGTLSLVLEPGATAYETLMQRAAESRLVVLDPNVRSSLISDRPGYVARFERWCRLAAVVRVSSADAGWLYPDRTIRQVGDRLVELGVTLAIITDGGVGSIAMTAAAGSVEVPAPPVDVVDTIGAGDTFNGAMLVWLEERNIHDRDAVLQLDARELDALLRFANTAAALTCSRPGADPPRRHELESCRSATL